MTAPGAPVAEQSRWGIVALAVGAGVVGAFQIGKMPAAIPVLRAELELSLVAAGWVISMMNVVGLAGGMLVGAMADRLGHRGVVVAGLLAMAAGSGIGALAPDAVWLLFSRLVEGIGTITVFVAAPGLIVRAVRPQDLRLSFGFWGAYMPAGTSLMVLLTPALLGLAGWRGLWAINAGLLVAFAVLLLAGTKDFAAATARDRGSSHDRSAGMAETWRAIRDTLSVPGPWLLAACFMTYTANYLAVLGFLPTFLTDELGMDATGAALLTGLAIAANIPGNLFGGWLLHRGAARWLLIVMASAIMGASAWGIYGEALAATPRYLLCVAFSMGGGLLPASVLGGGPVHAPRPGLVATTNGLIMQGSNLGQFAGPPALAAMVTAAAGWDTAPLLVGGLAALGCGLAVAIGVLERRVTPRPAGR